MIQEVGVGGGGTRPWEPRGKWSLSVSKGPSPKPTYTNIAIAEKQSKRSKNGHFRYILVPSGPTQEMKLMGPGGEGPSRSPPPPDFSSHVHLPNILTG